MKRKKTFISPQVLNQVDICLEKDLLVGGSVQYEMEVRTGAIYNVDTDLADEQTYDLEWD